MRILVGIFLAFCGPALMAEYSAEFKIGGKLYQLTGGYAVITQKNGKTQLMLAVKDGTAKAQFAVTAELPDGALGNTTELSTELHPLSAVIVNPKGIYSVIPHVNLARDDFMIYNAKEEIDTGELEDHPKDRPHERIHECRQGYTERCLKLAKEQRAKKKKIRVHYRKHGPTWVGKSRKERIDSGDGVHKDNKYKDTTFTLRLTPVIVDGKLTAVNGTFAGVVVYNEGLNPAQKATIQNGKFSMQVKNGF